MDSVHELTEHVIDKHKQDLPYAFKDKKNCEAILYNSLHRLLFPH
jgi:hypothetical protein